MRVEPDGINQHEPRLLFCCDAICIADLDPTIFIKWICKEKLFCSFTASPRMATHFLRLSRQDPHIEGALPSGSSSLLFSFVQQRVPTSGVTEIPGFTEQSPLQFHHV